MTQQPLLDLRPRSVADTSLLALDSLQPLKALDLEWLMKVYRYLQNTGREDVTGGELANYYRVPVTSTRPRLTGCFDHGWLTKGPIRQSRVEGEGRCRGYAPCIPLDAALRALRAVNARERDE